VKAHMRYLQTVRMNHPTEPIRDVPYNLVLFLMENGDVIACEGRGPNRSGAHTIGHNRDGYGTAFAANMEALPNPRVGLYVPKINFVFGWVKANQLPRLGPFDPHQKYSSTLCPGQAVIPQIKNFRYDTSSKEEDMALILVRKDGDDAVYVTDWIWKRHVTKAERDALRSLGIPFLDPMPKFMDELLDNVQETTLGGDGSEGSLVGTIGGTLTGKVTGTITKKEE
ncbi:hypothetical protein LCGC14_2721350, partial [marine sediment metagenome]